MMSSSSSSSSSSTTVRVEKATSDLLLDPDWTLNMDICDSINSDHWQAKDVVKAVKKRLQHKNPKVQFLALVLLEMMIKNCGDFVHFQVVEREVLQEMVKIIRKKTDMQVRDKILVLLDSWQEAFGGAGGKYPQFYWAYADLKRSRIEFPPRSPDSALIFTPPSSHATPALTQPQAVYGMPNNSTLRLEEAMATEMATLSLSDLASMRSVMELLSEMLKAVDPNDHTAVKDEVITDLVDQCRSNQKKLMLFLNSTRDEELLCQGLELNDNLQSLLAKHDAIASGSPLPTEASESLPSASTPVLSPPAVINVIDDEEEDEDDDFTQLARRSSKLKSDGSSSTSMATSNQVALPTQGDITTSTEASSSNGALPSAKTNALVLSDPPVPVGTSMKEQDMIDLLSLALVSNPSPPHSPLAPSFASNQSGYPASVSPSEQVSSRDSEPFPSKQERPPENGYIAPWAQAQSYSPSPSQLQSQPQVSYDSSSYPPPPWVSVPANANTNPFASTAYQYPATSAGAAGVFSQMQDSRPLQQYNSFGSTANTIQVSKMEAQTTSNLGQTASKPYVYKSRLFNDLVELRNPDGTVKATSQSPNLSGVSNQGKAL